MADNVSVTPGTGVTIATRDAGSGVEVQRVIPNTFAAGVATDVSITAPLPTANIWNASSNTLEFLRTPTIFKSFNAVASGTTVWTPASGKKFRILGFTIQCSVAGNVLLVDTGTAGSTPFVVPCQPTATPTVRASMENGFLSSTVNNTLVVTGPGTISGSIFGTEE